MLGSRPTFAAVMTAIAHPPCVASSTISASYAPGVQAVNRVPDLPVGEAVILITPPCTFSRCFNSDKQGVCRQNNSLADGYPDGMFGPVYPSSAYRSRVAAIGMRPCPQHW